MSDAPQILYCHCANARVVPQATQEAVLRELCNSGVPFEAVADLCELSARRDPALKRLAGSGTLTIAACYPRAVKGLFEAAGAPLAAGNDEGEETGGVQILNLRTEEAGTVCAAIRAKAGEGRASCNTVRFENLLEALEAAAAKPEGWQPWFPVIDYARCTHCMQCLSFCLFGVYGVDSESRIEAVHPELCKTNCPACSRVCPEAAIIFPKHKAGPINGDEPTESGRETMKVDISALLGGDIYSLLRNRGERTQPRFSKERDPDQALEERRRCLAALAHAGEIPPEVWMNLPSAEEIARRATEARARADAFKAQKP